MSHGARFRAAFVTAATVVTALALSIFLSGASSAGPTTTWQRQTLSPVAPGWYSSLVLDGQGRPHVAYRETSTLLKYAYYDGTQWRGEAGTTPDTVFSGQTIGYQVSLALDGSGVPHIAFATQGGSPSAQRMRYASWNGSAWTDTVVQTQTSNRVGLYPSLAIDGTTPHVSYIDCTVSSGDWRSCPSGGRLMYATTAGGAWTTIRVDPETVPADPATYSIDGYTSLALDSAGRPHIAYYEKVATQLKYATYDGTSWATSVVATSTSGREASLALYDDVPRIVYGARYLVKSGATWIVTSFGTSMGQPSLAVDGAGHPHVAYRGSYSGKTYILHRWDGGTGWQSEPVATLESGTPPASPNGQCSTPRDEIAGWYPSLALDASGRARVSYFIQTNCNAGGTYEYGGGLTVYAHLSAPPVATDDDVTVDEDTTLTADVLSNDASGYGFSGALTLTQIKTAPTSGTASVVAGKVSYTPNKDWNGDDSLVYEACDQNGSPALCSTATLAIHVAPVNDLPVPKAEPTSMTVQYGDSLAGSIAITATDVESSADELSFSATGLPDGVTMTDNLDGTATIAGTPTEPAGVFSVSVTATDPDNGEGTVTVPITVTSESVLVRPAQSNPHAVLVTASGAPSMTFTARITEAADGTYDVPGHLSDATITFKLDPIGGGPGAACTGTVTRAVTATATTPAFVDVTCTLGAGLGVDVYELTITVSGGYYQGVGESGVTVFDPKDVNPNGGGSVAIGGGTGEFFFTAKYLKSKQVQGKMLFILTVADDSQSVLKGNVMSTLAVKEGTAVITGKATLDGVGNYTYTLTAHDGGTTGDTFGLEVKDPAKKTVSFLTFAPAPVDGDAVHVLTS
jgi:hypothetical protein